MTSLENNKLDAFFINERKGYKETVVLLIKELKKAIDFKFKFLKASIQLVNKTPFAVIAFRRSKPYFFVEFYSTEQIKSPRIIKTIDKADQQIINRVNVLSIEQIDEELLNWIQKSKVIAETNLKF